MKAGGPLLATAIGSLLAAGAFGFSQFNLGAVKTQNLDLSKWKHRVEAFDAQSFVPSQNWLGLASNQHWQTIVATGALRKVLFGVELQRSFDVHSKLIKTSDGDEHEAEFTVNHFDSKDLDDIGGDEVIAKKDISTPIVVLLHGLEANAKGTLMTKMCEEYTKVGFGCVLVSFRGCNGTENKRVGAYHLGFTQDLDQLTDFLKKKYPNRPIYLSGFSLGGNVSLKFLGELGDKAVMDRNIQGAVTMSVPFDLVESGAKIDKGFNKVIYAGNFLRTLIKKAEKQHALLEGKVPYDIEVIKRCRTIGDFDDAFIAKIYGFKDKFDYYRQSQAKSWLHKIRVPCVNINAIDDPFIEASSLPNEEHVQEAPVRLIYTQSGGHCGFVDINNNDRWIAQEMARALLHIHEGYGAINTMKA